MAKYVLHLNENEALMLDCALRSMLKQIVDERFRNEEHQTTAGDVHTYEAYYRLLSDIWEGLDDNL